MTTRPFRHLCPEAEERDAMSDNEFWERVTANILGEQPEPYDDTEDLKEVPAELLSTPCSVCGGIGACGYDAEGRPMIHVEEDDDVS